MPEQESLDANAILAYVGSAVRKYREAKGLTQTGLAEILEIRQSALSEIEAGRRHVSLKRLSQLCAVLGKKSKDLLPF